MARARDRDPEACRRLVELHQEVAFRTAYLLIGDAAEAEDATQEAFVKALGALDRFRDESPFRPWLLTIVANVARNRLRSTTRRLTLGLRAAAASRDRPAAPSAEAIVVADERRHELLAAINRLSPDDRLVIAGRYFLDLSGVELAALAGVRPGTVKSRLARARARLAALLDESDGGASRG